MGNNLDEKKDMNNINTSTVSNQKKVEEACGAVCKKSFTSSIEKFIDVEWTKKALKTVARIGVEMTIGLVTVVPPLFTTIAAGMTLYDTTTTIEENSEKYATEIEAYNDMIHEYSKKYEGKDLDRFEIMMGVMEDVWNDAKGYGSPEIDAKGYLELDMSENGVGVCRNIASDYAKRLNEIDPSFNARTISVYADFGNESFDKADIQRKILNNDENTIVNETADEIIMRTFGNHMGVLVDYDNKIIFVDPTTLLVGQLTIGGEFGRGVTIKIFNDTESGRVFEMTPKGFSDIFINKGIHGTGEVIEDYFRSYDTRGYTFEELKEMMGTSAQKKAIEHKRNVFRKDKNNSDKVAQKYGISIEDIYEAMEKEGYEEPIINDKSKEITIEEDLGEK